MWFLGVTTRNQRIDRPDLLATETLTLSNMASITDVERVSQSESASQTPRKTPFREQILVVTH